MTYREEAHSQKGQQKHKQEWWKMEITYGNVFYQNNTVYLKDSYKLNN